MELGTKVLVFGLLALFVLKGGKNVLDNGKGGGGNRGGGGGGGTTGA